MTSNYEEPGILHVNDGAQYEKSNQEYPKPSIDDVLMLSNILDGNLLMKNAVYTPTLHQLEENPPQILASQKRFFFVDRSGGKTTIYVHPSTFTDMSTDLQGKNISDLQTLFGQAISPDILPMADLVFLKEEQWDDSTEKGIAFKRLVNSAVTALHEMLRNGNRLLFSTSHSFLTLSKPEALSTCNDSWNVNDMASSGTSSTSLVDDSVGLELLLSLDDEASSDEALLDSDDEMSTGQSPAYDIGTQECESSHQIMYKCRSGKYIRRNGCDLEGTDEQSTEVFVTGNPARAFSICKQIKLSNVSSVAVSTTTDLPLSEELSSPSSFQDSDQSCFIPSLSTGVASNGAVKRKRSVYETSVHSGSAKKPMQKLQLIQSVTPEAAELSGDAAVTNEAIIHGTFL